MPRSRGQRGLEPSNPLTVTSKVPNMFRLNDIILLLVIFSSMVAGIMFPGFANHFQPYPLFLMMFLLFLSFLPIKLDDIWLMIRHNLW